MALPKAYMTSTKRLKGMFNAIQNAQAPERFTQRFLENLEFKSASDRLFIGVLKALGFLKDDGKPTQRYYDYLDQTQSGRVLADGIREAYKDLFQVNVNAHKMTKTDLVNKLKTLTQGKASESVLLKMAMTFLDLCKLADFEAVRPVGETPREEGEEAPKEEETEKEDGGREHREEVMRQVKLGGLVYNIQLILPESRDPAVYDALFRSFKEHLL